MRTIPLLCLLLGLFPGQGRAQDRIRDMGIVKASAGELATRVILREREHQPEIQLFARRSPSSLLVSTTRMALGGLLASVDSVMAKDPKPSPGETLSYHAGELVAGFNRLRIDRQFGGEGDRWLLAFVGRSGYPMILISFTAPEFQEWVGIVKSAARVAEEMQSTRLPGNP